jgi:pimeloyl-ACP methyl ester carboxylesterase
MPRIEVGRENSGPIELHYEDYGSGRPVILIHGWPQAGASWERQMVPLLGAGYRVIVYDRRGFGLSSKPAGGYEYDTLARDLHTIIERLDLRDVSLVGFSMGGGEVARYIGTYGSGRVRTATLVSAIPPFLLKGPDNPGGVDGSVFDGIIAGLEGDRPGFLTGFLSNFYNVDVLRGSRISDDAVRAFWNVAVSASPIATIECVRAWTTDFRHDLEHFDVPTLILHGEADRIVPADVSARPAHAAIDGSQLEILSGAPHGMTWTHADEVNGHLLAFLEARTHAAA